MTRRTTGRRARRDPLGLAQRPEAPSYQVRASRARRAAGAGLEGDGPAPGREEGRAGGERVFSGAEAAQHVDTKFDRVC